eukprot:TRINITY_DN11417_c0_g1_i7.p1 TRINITY_DN11417_c0_g1~~TRINITY_DN11417_c0_g1_i7.p1  ORF type:complete len:920 (-),score=286.13 TRINITY_DN11417_c0_g1_i7:291-2840(-)
MAKTTTKRPGEKPAPAKGVLSQIMEKTKLPTKEEETKKASAMEVARKELAACKMKGGGSSCLTAFEKATGMKQSKSGKESAKEKLEEEKGAIGAVMEMMKSCTLTPAACKAKVEQSLKNLTGTAASKEDTEMKLQKAGQQAAGKAITDCAAAATTAADKAKCRTSTAAKQALAKASGKSVNDVTELDLKKAVMEFAAKSVKDAVAACQSLVTGDANKTACRKSNSNLKDSVANALGKAKSALKDSEVSKFLEKGAREDALLAMKSCNRTANLSACKELAKKAFQDATGQKVDEYTLQRKLKEALGTEVADKMSTCTQAAADKKAREACKMTVAREQMKKADLSADSSSKEPSMADVEEMLKDAAASKAKEIAESCTKSRVECMALTKESIAQAMGKLKSEITDLDTEKFNKEGAMKASVESAKACFEAKKSNASSSCEDLYEKMLKLRGKSKPQGAAAQRADEQEVKKELAKSMAKDQMSVCFKKLSKSELDACFQSFKNESEGVANTLFSGESVEKVRKKMDRAKKEASVQALGEIFSSCMEAANTSALKVSCMAALTTKKAVAGLVESAIDVVDKFHMSAVIDAGKACNSTQRKSCMEAAKAGMVKLGMEARQFARIKQLGEVKAAAEVWAACKDSNGTESSCEALAKSRYEEVSGAVGGFTTEVLDKIKQVGQAFANGVATTFKKLKAIQVDAVTSSTTCSDAELNISVRAVTKHCNASGSAFASVVGKRCRVVEGKAEYQVHVATPTLNATEMANLSSSIASNLTGENLVRRLSLRADARRLGAVTESYADQAVELESASSSSPSPSPVSTADGIAPGTSTSTGCNMTSASPALLILAFIINMFF